MVNDALSKPSFLGLGEDILVHILSFLDLRELVNVCATCVLLRGLKDLRIVWTLACQRNVIQNGYPFPSTPLSSFSIPALAERTIYAYTLGNRWLSGLVSSSRGVSYIFEPSGMAVSDVRFVPGHDRLLVAVSNSLWSTISVWYMDVDVPRRVATWESRGAIFNEVVIDSTEYTNRGSAMAVFMHLDGCMSVKILRFDTWETDFEELWSLKTNMKPFTLVGDIIALADNNSSLIEVYNWKLGTSARFKLADDVQYGRGYNPMIQILFAHESLLAIRTQCIHLFPYSPRFLKPTAQDLTGEIESLPIHPLRIHSFGWVVNVSACASITPYIRFPLHSVTVMNERHAPSSSSSWDPIHILIRRDMDDPWASDVNKIELYTLPANSSYSSPSPLPSPSILDELHPLSASVSVSAPAPYVFPPILASQTTCSRGTLECRKILLGRFGTAIWIAPHLRWGNVAGLLSDAQWRMATSGPANVLPGGLGPELGNATIDREKQDPYESLKFVAFGAGLKVRSLDHKASESGEGGPEDEADHVVQVNSIKVASNDHNNWTALDYDEVGGRIALASRLGKIEIISL